MDSRRGAAVARVGLHRYAHDQPLFGANLGASRPNGSKRLSPECDETGRLFFAAGPMTAGISRAEVGCWVEAAC